MDKKFIFISYASTDNEKVEILKALILASNSFEPIIIADQRRALKPLAQKVIDGIQKSDYVIPIITFNSFKEQWLNQEIGYSISQSKTIIPIVQKEIIKDLKGFIHGEIDLPYNFSLGTRLIRTGKNEFLKACKLLLSDIENETVKSIKVEQKKEPLVVTALKIKEIRDRHLSKETLKNSPELVNKFNLIVLREIIENIELKIEKIRKETTIPFVIKTLKDKELGIIFSAEGFSISLYWETGTSSIKDSLLIQKFWEGLIPTFHPVELAPSDRDKILKKGEKKFYPDISDSLDYIWINKDQGRKIQITSEQISNDAIGWVLKSIEIKYKK